MEGCCGPLLGSSCHNGTQGRGRQCAPDIHLIRESVCRSCRTRRRCWRGLPSSARLLGRMLSGLAEGFKAVRHHASPILACCLVLSRPYPRGGSVRGNTATPCSVRPVTTTRKDGSANAPRTTTSHEKAFAARAELLVDDWSVHLRRHAGWSACSPAPWGGSRARGNMPHVSCPCRPSSRCG